MFEKEVEQLNRYIELYPVAFEKRTYTVDEIRDILSIGKTQLTVSPIPGSLKRSESAAPSGSQRKALMNGWIKPENKNEAEPRAPLLCILPPGEKSRRT